MRIIWDNVVDEITGTVAKAPLPASVSGIRLKNVKTGETTELATHGVFVAIGHAPAVELLKGQLKYKPNGYLWTAANSTATDVPGALPPVTLRMTSIVRRSPLRAWVAWQLLRPSVGWLPRNQCVKLPNSSR